jgi:hypothetical protein
MPKKQKKNHKWIFTGKNTSKKKKKCGKQKNFNLISEQHSTIPHSLPRTTHYAYFCVREIPEMLSLDAQQHRCVKNGENLEIFITQPSVQCDL